MTSETKRGRKANDRYAEVREGYEELKDGGEMRLNYKYIIYLSCSG